LFDAINDRPVMLALERPDVRVRLILELQGVRFLLRHPDSAL
jgi:hypothetical protein